MRRRDRAHGVAVKSGRPPISLERKKLALKLWFGGNKMHDICARTRLWSNSVYKIVHDYNKLADNVCASDAVSSTSRTPSAPPPIPPDTPDSAAGQRRGSVSSRHRS